MPTYSILVTYQTGERKALTIQGKDVYLLMADLARAPHVARIQIQLIK